MEMTIKALILQLISTLYGPFLYLPAPFPKIFDCRYITYCSNFSDSCIKHYEELGGTTNYEDLVEKYPCCLCSSKNNKTCVCAKGGFVVRDLTLKIFANNPTVQVGIYLIITGFVDFKPKAEDCVMNSDCKNAPDCTSKCKQMGIKKLNEKSKCCSCGPPLADSCENCSCATNTTYARIHFTSALTNFLKYTAIFQVTITEGPILTQPAQAALLKLSKELIRGQNVTSL